MAEDIGLLIADLAEPALRERGLLARPISFFDRLDRFRAGKERLAPDCRRLLTLLPEEVAAKMVQTYHFAGELSRDALGTPADGERAQRSMAAAAVLLDHILDEEHEDAAHLAPLREWLGRRSSLVDQATDERPRLRTAESNVVLSMMAGYLADCRRRAQQQSEYGEFHIDFMRMLDAELASPGASLNSNPDGRVRRVVRDKSVLLCWVGFRSCLLGSRAGTEQLSRCRSLCTAVGEVLWIVDDLADLEEDLDRGVWNRTLWTLWDRVGERRFRTLTRSKARLAEAVRSQSLVELAVSEIAEQVELAERHRREEDQSELRSMLAFWIATWLGIYA